MNTQFKFSDYFIQKDKEINSDINLETETKAAGS